MNDEKFKFSIIMPVKNGEKYIRQAIDSILDQRYSNYELIVQDSLSIDSTSEIVRSYSDQRIKIYTEKDLGQSDALNKGFGKASGDLIFWLNSDDMLAPNFFKRVSCFFELNPRAVVVYGSTLFIDENGRVLFANKAAQIINRYFKYYSAAAISGPSVVVRRGMLCTLNFPLFPVELRYSMDVFFYRMVSCHYKFHYIGGLPLWFFRIHVDSKTGLSITGKLSDAQAEEYRKIRKFFKYNTFFMYLFKMVHAFLKNISLSEIRKHLFFRSRAGVEVNVIREEWSDLYISPKSQD